MKDFDINELKFLEHISVRSFNILKGQGILYLSQIIDYYKSHQSFLNIQNCGLRSESELISLCEKYYYASFDRTHSEQNGDVNSYDIKIQDLYFDFRLSYDTKAFLKRNKFQSIDDVSNCFSSKKAFMSMPGWTQEINKEVEFFLRNIELSKINTEIYASDNFLIKQIPEDLLAKLNNTEFNFIQHWFKKSFQSMSIRSQNIINKLISEEAEIKEYYLKFILGRFNFTKVRNAGSKTINEIKKFNKELQEKIDHAKGSTINIDNNFASFIAEFSKQSNLPYNDLLKYEKKFLDKQFPLFEIFTEFFIPKSYSNTKYQQLVNCLILREFEGRHLKEIADICGYSFERVRQLKIKLIPQVLEFFNFDLKLSSTILEHTSYLTGINDVIYLNKIRNYYFQEDIINIKNEIIYKALGNILKHTHVLFIKETNEKIFAFLISIEINDNFCFDDFASDFEEKLELKKTEEEFLNLEGYIFKFINEFEHSKFHRIKKVCENIIENGYGLSISHDGNIVFPQNANKNLPDLIFEALDRLGQPSHVNEIIAELQYLYPGREFSVESIRSNVLRIPNAISFGRTSTYGLKEWEVKKGIRGGTIRDIVEEFLEKFDVPKHILEIEEYVLQYRETNEKNILANLKLEGSRFKIFPGAIVGLSSKHYDLTKIKFKRMPANSPDILKKYLKDKKLKEDEFEAVLIKIFNIGVYQARYWLRQHKVNGTFAKNLIIQ